MGKQYTFDGKTDKELLEEINNGLYAICLEHGGDIQEEYKKKIIYIYFDKYDNAISQVGIELLKQNNNDNMRKYFDVTDDWKDNYIEIDVERILKLLFFLDRESLFSVVKDIMNCLV